MTTPTMIQSESCAKKFDQQNLATQHMEDGVSHRSKTGNRNQNWSDSQTERDTDRSGSQTESDTDSSESQSEIGRDESQLARDIAEIDSYIAWDMETNESQTESDTDSVESTSESDISSSEESYDGNIDIRDNQNNDIDAGETRMESKENRILVQDENKNEHQSRIINERENENVCLDWVYDAKSEVHVAKDRAWFTEYTRIESKTCLCSGRDARNLRIIGVGAVELPIVPPPGSRQEDSPRILRLTKVLHVPDILCNIIGHPINDDHTICHCSWNTKGSIIDRDDRNIAYFDPTRPLLQIKLRDPPSNGYYALKHKTRYAFEVLWRGEPEHGTRSWHVHSSWTSISAQEKLWLQEHFGDEATLLQVYRLNIHVNRDREAGKDLLRRLMKSQKRSRRERKRRRLHY